jgi:hypothetical protein
MIVIYGLIGEKTNNLFYIGATARELNKRLYEHLYHWQKERSPKGDAMRANEGKVIIVPLFQCDKRISNVDFLMEYMFIRYFYDLGFSLTNQKIPFKGKFYLLPVYTPYIKCWRSAVKKLYKKYPEIFGNKSRYTYL